MESAVTFAIFAPLVATSLIVVGASYGISRIATTAVEGMARQPEASGAIRTGMIVAAALIEGVSFFSVIVCLVGTNGVLEIFHAMAQKYVN